MLVFEAANIGQNLATFFSKDYPVTGGEMETLAEQLSFWGFDRGYALTQSHSLHLPDYQSSTDLQPERITTRLAEFS